MRKSSRRVRFVVAGLTALACAVVATRRLPLWVPGQCAWSYSDEILWPMALPMMGLLAVLLIVHTAWSRPTDPSEGKDEGRPIRVAGFVALVCLLAMAISLSARLIEKFGLARLTLLTMNPASGGFFQAAYDTKDTDNWLRQFPELMKRERHHVAAHPPGNVVLARWWLDCTRANPGWEYWADEATSISPGERLTSVAAFCGRAWQRPYGGTEGAAAFWFGAMMLASAAAIPACVFVATRALFGETAARHSTALAAAVPSLILFVPACDLGYAFVSSLAFALAAVGACRAKMSLLALAGLLLGLGMAASFAVAAVVVMTAGFVLLQTCARPRRARASLLAALLSGFAVALAILQMAGVDWLAVGRAMNFIQAQKIVESNRDYKLWLVFNLADFVTFLGLPIAALLVIAARRARADWRDFAAVAVPQAAVIALTDLSGFAPAETARIWMLFIPPLLPVAGAALARLAEEDRHLPLIVLVAQTIQCLVFALFFNVWTFA